MTNTIEIRISDRTDFAGGHSFGATGPYERLTGRAHYAVDPNAPAQAGITDIDKAPVNADGLVEFVADVCIFKPVEIEKGKLLLIRCLAFGDMDDQGMVTGRTVGGLCALGDH